METSGALVHGGYGHSSVYDPQTRSIYIHGGYKAFNATKYGLAGDLYRYDVDSSMWWAGEKQTLLLFWIILDLCIL